MLYIKKSHTGYNIVQYKAIREELPDVRGWPQDITFGSLLMYRRKKLQQITAGSQNTVFLRKSHKK